MLSKVKEYVIRNKVAYLLEKYHVEVKHYIPGRIRAIIRNWESKYDILLKLITELELDPAIYKVNFTKETGSILIQFNEDAINDRATIERWKTLFEKYPL